MTQTPPVPPYDVVIESPLALATTIAVTTAFAFWLDRHVKALSKIGASLLAIILGAVLSNLGIVATESPVLDGVVGLVTSLAIAWLVLAVDLSDIKRAGAPMLAAFAIGILGTAVGAATSGVIFHTAFPDNAWRLAGTMAGSFSGGAVNFVAVGRGLEIPNTLFIGMLAADAVVTTIWLGACLFLPRLLGRFFPTPTPGEGAEPQKAQEHPLFGSHSVSVADLSLHLAAAFFLVLAAEKTANVIPKVPSVLWLTTYALILGRVAPLPKRESAFQLGYLGLHLFFVVVGMYARFGEILSVGPEIFLFTVVVIGIHGLVVFGVGRIAGLDLGSLTVASQAAIGGPSTSLAVAISKKEWRHLMLPGVLVGLLGYALGNYLGFGIGYLGRVVTTGF